MNPLDYIYGALGCSLSPLKPFENAPQKFEVVDKDSSIAKLIMQYVYNSANKDIVIEAIYRTKVDGEKVRVNRIKLRVYFMTLFVL